MKFNARLLICVIILIISGASGFSVSWYHNISSPAPATPATQTLHYPTVFVDQLKGDKQAGEKIYIEYCSSCHNSPPVIDVKAPLVTDKKAWLLRRQQGMATLLKNTINGKAAMPARGGCFECSDEQLRATIQYMLDLTPR
jgi:cytochrome c5